MNSLDIASIATLAAQGLVVRVLRDGSVEVRADAAAAAAAAPRSAGARRTAAYRQRKALKDQAQAPKETPHEGASPGVTRRDEASQDVTGRHDASHDVTGRHDASQNVTGRDVVSPGVTERHDASQNVTGRDEASQDVTKHHDASQDVTERHDASQDVTKRHDASPGVTERHEASQNVTGRHEASQGVTVGDAAAVVPPSLLSPALPLSSQTLLSPSHPLASHPLGGGVKAAEADADAGAEAGTAAAAGAGAAAKAETKPENKPETATLAFALGCEVAGPVPPDGAAGQAGPKAATLPVARTAAEGDGADDARRKGLHAGQRPEGKEDSPGARNEDETGDEEQPRRRGRRKRKTRREAAVGWREWNRTRAAAANAVALPLLAPPEFHAAWQRWQGYRTRRAAEARIASEAVAWTADAAEAGLRECERAADAFGWAAVVARIDQAIAGGWQGINTDKLAPHVRFGGGAATAAPGSAAASFSSHTFPSQPHSHAYANHRSSSSHRSDSANRPGRYACAPPTVADIVAAAAARAAAAAAASAGEGVAVAV